MNNNVYFENTDLEYGRYINPQILIKFFEDMTNTKKGFNELKHIVENIEVTITKEEIMDYLNKKFEEENPELKRRIEKRKTQKSEKFFSPGKMSNKEIEESAQRFVDEIEASRYKFSSYTLKYFKKYVEILKRKLLILFNLIEKISIKDYSSIEKYICDLDINIDENGNILYEDIMRLIEPTVYNIDQLLGKVEKANNPMTYLEFTLSKAQLYKEGICEEELYPSSSLQTYSPIAFNDIKGYVPLSSKQKKVLEEEHNRNIAHTAKFIADLWD